MPKNDNTIWANSQSKNICHFHKSLGIERLPFSLKIRCMLEPQVHSTVEAM